MKRIISIVIFFLIFTHTAVAEEYPNSWKIDLLCKQGKWQWGNGFNLFTDSTAAEAYEQTGSH